MLGAGSNMIESRGTTLLESVPQYGMYARMHAGMTLHSFQARSVTLDALLHGNGELPAGATGHRGRSSRVAVQREVIRCQT